MALAMACNSHETTVAPVPSASVAAPSVSAAPSAAIHTPSEYGGSYTAAAGTLFVPDAAPWDHFKFRGNDAGSLGEGSIRLVIAPRGGALSGDLQGPLGPASLTGMVQGNALSFQLVPGEQTPGAPMYSGTGTGTIDGGVISGEIHASSWHGDVLREATFRAQRR